MNIEDSIKTLKEFNKIKINSYAMQFVNISYPNLQEAIEALLTAYEKEKEKNKKIENELEKHIKFCEQEAEGSLNNEICHMSLKFNKRLLDIFRDEEFEI